MTRAPDMRPGSLLFPEVVARLMQVQFVRYLAVGGINTGLSYGVYALALYAGWHYALASLASVVFGMLSSFLLQSGLVFHNTDPRLLVRFLLLATVLYGAHTGLLKWAASAGIDLYLAAAALVLPLSGLSFVLNKFLVFAPRVR